LITQEILDKLNSDMINIEYSIKSLNSKIETLIQSREKEASRLEDETAKLQSVNSGVSIVEMENIKARLSSSKHEIEDRWGGIVDLKTITHDEFLIAYDIINSMSEIVVHISSIIPESEVNSLYLSSMNEMNQIDNDIEDIVSFRNSMEVHEYKLDILNQRPSGCKDDTCPFIADALHAKAILDEFAEKRKNSKNSVTMLYNRKSELESILDNIDKNKQLITLYNANRIILRKLNLGLDSYDECVLTLKSRLGEILSILNNLIDYSNDLTEYKSLESDLIEIDSKFRSLSSQRDLINMITSSIDKLNIQIDEDTKEINRINDQILEETKRFNDMTNLFNNLTNIYNLRVDLNECEESLRILDEEIDKDKSSIDKIEKLNSDIEKLTVNISELKTQLEPLRKRAEQIRYKITLSTEYNREYEEYNMAYSKIETLKYYCSPTTGIQLLFVNIYLNKIMESANNILSKLFNGTFALLPLVITESEFRIPVAVNGGINHDDITSMSSAQIALISMIISISLLSQTSTKLNIIVGDEIDAPFDSENRREFINILTQLMSLVKSSQCVLISHNSEIPMNECDVILLKNENDVVTVGNIIWSYK
jgi:DNA repair exonuclease SbcCD ATPase subunit